MSKSFVPIQKVKGFELFALVMGLVCTLTSASVQALTIENIEVTPNGDTRISFTASASNYYILDESERVDGGFAPIQMLLGEQGAMRFFIKNLIQPSARFFIIRQIPINAPLDSDADGIDDVFELRHPAILNPLNDSDALLDPDGDGISTLVEYQNGLDPELPQPLTTLSETSPLNGESGVSVTRETIVRFTLPLSADAVITTGRFQAMAGGRTLLSRIELSSDRRTATLFYLEPLPGSTRISATFDGTGLTDFVGRPLDADGDGQPGGVAPIVFDTYSNTPVPGTAVTGHVFASELVPGPDTGTNAINRPLEGVVITVDGKEQEMRAMTDATGSFTLSNCPAGRFFVHIDGRTVTNLAAGIRFPDLAYYPFVGKAWEALASYTNLAGDGPHNKRTGNIYLPLIVAGTLQPVSATEDTTITFPPSVIANNPALAGVSITVPANSLYSENGTRGGKVGIAPVPPDRLPGPLPAGANPAIVITVQTDGPQNFDRPVPVRFPNLPDLATGTKLGPGEKAFFFSFIHDTGNWEIIGTGTVSEDGLTVLSDPGIGIRAPGWHFVVSGSANFQLNNPRPEELKGYAKRLPIPKSTDDLLAIATYAVLKSILQGFDFFGIDAARFAEEIRRRVPEFKLPICGRCTYTVGHVARFIESLGDIYYPAGSDLSIRAAKSQGHQTLHNRDVLPQIKNEIDRRILKRIPGTDISLLLKSSGADIVFNSELDLIQAIDFSEGFEIEGFVNVDVVKKKYVVELTYTYRDAYGFEPGETPAREMQEMGLARPFVVEFAIHESAELTPGVPLDSFQAKTFGLQVSSDSPVAESEAVGFGTLPYVFFKFELTNGFAVSGRSDANGVISGILLPPNTEYKAYFYHPQSNRGKTMLGFSSASGTVFSFGSNNAKLPLYDFGGIDTDGDGLPDVGELALGTDPNKADTDGDGISDSAEIAQGLDPLDDRGFPTGIIASLPLPGEAKEVVVEGTTAYLATGSHGLAIVDVTRFNNPILVGQLDLPGDATGVAVDPTLKLALVATGPGGLQFVDVSDPMTPKLTRTVAIPVTRVEAFAGAAFAATSGSIALVELLTGSIVSTLDLGPDALTDLTLEGSFLYTMDTERILRAIELDGLDMIPHGSLQLAEGGGRIFVGNGIAYVPVGDSRSGGFSTANVSNPDALTLISNTDRTDGRPGSAIVPNGSGLGLLVGTIFPQSPVPQPRINVMDLRDPANTDNILIAINMPGRPQSAAIASGIGFVANAQSGLQVVNYLPFDNKGNAPTIKLAASFSLEPPVADEGNFSRISAQVLDDVQVRDVEFYIDGILANKDVSFPFEHRFVTPSISITKTDFTIRAKATDTGGNSTWSDEIAITLAHDITPPRVRRLLPSDKSVIGPGTDTVIVYFSEPINTPTLTSANFHLLSPGADNRFGTADDLMLSDGVISYRDAPNAAVISFPSPLPLGVYQGVLTTNITDLAGNAMAREFRWAFAFLSGGPDDDDDGDYLSNADELEHGTNPLVADTDGDGWLDGIEIGNETDPLDLNSRPTVTFVAQPLVEVELPSAETFGTSGAAFFLARPPAEISLPSAETFGTAGVGVYLALPPVEISLPSAETFGTSGIGVFLALPPVDLTIEKQ